MAAGVNRVILIGHVGRDADVRFTQGGTPVANFTLATSEAFGGRDGTERQERTEWHSIVVWGRLAEVAGQYVKKGRQLFVEGRLQTRDWLDPQGIKHYKTEIVARNFQLLGRRDDAEGGGGSGGGGGRSYGGYSQGSPRSGGDDYGMEGGGLDDYDIGDLGPPLDMDSSPLSPGD
jgi:single-strand DNA-binding protein